MKWKKFTLKTTTEAVDLISSMFDEIGIEGIEIEDNVPLTEKRDKGNVHRHSAGASAGRGRGEGKLLSGRG